MTSWLTDTLAKRLFWLMAITLVASHFVAYLSVHSLLGPPGSDLGWALQRLPPMTSLPPMGQPPPRGAPQGDPGGPPPGVRLGGLGEGVRPGLPAGALALDYGIRFCLIALAAWYGARWLARPMTRLVAASQQLGEAIDRGRAPPRLDETRGTREVRDAAHLFNHMAQQIKGQFDARGLMISAISHDLRTPLTRLRMRLETSDNADAVLRDRSIDDIREMDQLIDSVLDLFRQRSADMPPQRIDVGALAQSLVDDLAELGQRVAGDYEADAVALADPAALKRVLGNLVGNGLRYGTRVQVAVRAEPDAVVVSVEDDGPGIPEAQLDAVFEPFVRVESSRSRQTGGVGLGLFIARELTQRQGGTLTLRNRDPASSPGRTGLCAQVRLRRALRA